MKLYTYPPQADWIKLIQRPKTSSSNEPIVRSILKRVQKQGDNAIIELTRSIDKVNLSNLRVDAKTISKAEKQVSPQLKRAIGIAYKNIYKFHSAQLNTTVQKIETMTGVACWRKPVAIEKVGLYIPGGSAPLFSTVLMLGIPARLAGCKEIILCSPPPVHPAILYAANICGIKTIFSVGGAQAIGAMAYGTETIPQVDKIFGPGNSFVTLAKQLVSRTCTAIDMPAGPSEVLVIADETANPAFVVADLLSQAEHGPDSQVILLSTNLDLVKSVLVQLEVQLKSLPRKNIAVKALSGSRVILLKSLEECIQFSNAYAPEHLILSCTKASSIAEKVINAGSVFIGNFSPESAGDYASGTNHTLPTGGYAKAYSGVSVDSFMKHITFQEISKKGLTALGETVVVMAEAEQLIAHRNAIRIRLK